METETHRGYCTTEEESTNKSKKVTWFTFWDNDFADKVELDLSNRELIQEDGKWFVVKKKPKFPTKFTECCEILYPNDNFQVVLQRVEGHKGDLLFHFQKLLICRDAYWKIAGEEMGLGKPWEPDWGGETEYYTSKYFKYTIFTEASKILIGSTIEYNTILTFPTEEMRDEFYVNFKELIEQCKELL